MKHKRSTLQPDTVLRAGARIGLLLVASLFLLRSNRAGAQESRTLRGHVPAAVGNVQAIGRLRAADRLHLAIGLPLRNQPALTDFIRRLYDPASPDYHQYLTPQQFTGKFGPTESDYKALIAFAKANAFEVTEVYPNRLLVNVEASVGAIENAFHTSLRVYQHPKENRAFFAPDVEPSVTTSVPLLHITGLNNFILPHPMDLRVQSVNKNPRPLIGGSRFGNFVGNDYRAAYAPGMALDGTSQSVGILAFDGYYTNDIALFNEIAGEPDVLVTNILLDGFNNAPGSRNLETALDIQCPISMAPGISKVIVYEGIFADSILNRMAGDNLKNN